MTTTDTARRPEPEGSATAAGAAAQPDEQRRDAFAEDLFRSAIGGLELLHVYLGDRLGLYDALADGEPVSPADLADRAGIAERYAREWLEQQAVAGALDVEEASADAGTRRFRLPRATAEVLCDRDGLSFLAPVASMVVGITRTMPGVLEAFRSGGGVPYEEYGTDVQDGIARLNRPMFLNQLATEWIPAMPDVAARLDRDDPPARVADMGCGAGWSTLALARGYPAARVDGIDVDQASIEAAQHNAADAGLADRVNFVRIDASDPRLAETYDLVTMFETLHDMAHPVEALRAARDLLAPGGAVLVADERVAEEFTAPGDEIERFNYGWSAVHCLPVGIDGPHAAGTGTVIRPDTVRRYAREAGFAEVTVLPIEHEFWRFYRLDP